MAAGDAGWRRSGATTGQPRLADEEFDHRTSDGKHDANNDCFAIVVVEPLPLARTLEYRRLRLQGKAEIGTSLGDRRERSGVDEPGGTAVFVVLLTVDEVLKLIGLLQ